MHKPTKLLMIGLNFLVLLSLTTPTIAATNSTTIPLHSFTQPISLINFCSTPPVVGDGTVTVNGVIHANVDAAGGSNYQATETGDLSITFGTVPYTGRTALWDMDVLAGSSGTYVATFTGTVILSGSDGSTLRAHITFSMTVASDGTILALVTLFNCF